MSALLDFSKDFYDEVLVTHKKMADFVREIGNKLRLQLSFYDQFTKFLAKNGRIYTFLSQLKS
jgi:hypothetical protein